MAKSTKSKTATASQVLVHFEFVHPTAQSICIAGTFNDWHGSATPMIALGEGNNARPRRV
ncbi:MAG: hypothetical protein L0Z50_05885 [Verrucomicrobiales bacterium]|nr:hypothetical protein [Verrucomicrobiales bacterium]